MHYAAHFKRAKMLAFLLKKAYKKYPDDYVKIINIKTKEGWSPMMICSIYKSVAELKVMYQAGGLLVDQVDKDGRNALKLSEYYGAVECYEVIKKND